MDWISIYILVENDHIDALCALLSCCGASGFEINNTEELNEFINNKTDNWDYLNENVLAQASAKSSIKFYLADNTQGQSQLAEVNAMLDNLRLAGGFGSLEITTDSAKDSDWAENWKKYYAPIVINNRITIVPSWEEYDDSKTEAVVRLDPGMAFGTGDHPTTMIAMNLLASLDIKAKKVCDIGCGSGILGIAAAKLGATSVLCTDYDELSVKITSENIAENNVCNICNAQQMDLAKDVNGKHEIIIANIVADIILRLIPDIPRIITTDGKFICSGIIDDRVEEIRLSLAKNGFNIIEHRREQDWNGFLVELA